MKGYLYLLLSKKDRKTYVGSTTDLQRRLEEHNRGKSIATKHRIPFELIYSEGFESIETARKREQFFKTKLGRKKLKEIFEAL